MTDPTQKNPRYLVFVHGSKNFNMLMFIIWHLLFMTPIFTLAGSNSGPNAPVFQQLYTLHEETAPAEQGGAPPFSFVARYPGRHKAVTVFAAALLGVLSLVVARQMLKSFKKEQFDEAPEMIPARFDEAPEMIPAPRIFDLGDEPPKEMKKEQEMKAERLEDTRPAPRFDGPEMIPAPRIFDLGD